jgi:bis(5'-nucleosyl)-tetraphosphatase (symmetrical)
MEAMPQTIVIGDVHGCFDELLELLDKCNYLPKKDRLILVGDIINKGPKSMDVLKWVRKNKIECVLGNHELKLLSCLAKEKPMTKWVAALAEKMDPDVQDWFDYIEAWPAFIEEKDFLVVHGGIVPGLDVKKTPVELLANIRTWDGVGECLNHPEDPSWYSLYKKDKLVVYGHWAVEGLNVRKNTIGLDSGCCYGNSLSGLILPNRKIVSVDAKKVYCTPV